MSRRFSRIVGLGLLCLLAPSWRPASGQDPGASMHATVRALCQNDTGGRRDWLRAALKKLGVEPDAQTFAPDRGAAGKNLVVKFGSTGPTVLMTAHFDRIRISPGANDDASGCAVLLGVVEHLVGTVRSRKPPLTILCAFLDQGATNSNGADALLAKLVTTPIVAVLDLDMVGVGDAVVYGPRNQSTDDTAQHALEAALAAIPEGELPRRTLSKLPPSDVAAYRQHGLDAVTLGMAPSADLDALQTHLEWKRRRGQRRPPPPAYLRMVRSPRDGADSIQGEALARALRVARGWLDAVLTSKDPGVAPRADYGVRCRELRQLLRSGEVAGLAERTGSHVDLLAALGPRGFFRTLLAELERDEDGTVEPVVRELLEGFVAGERLKGGLRLLLEDDPPIGLAEGLRSLYEANRGALEWDATVPAFRVKEKTVK